MKPLFQSRDVKSFFVCWLTCFKKILRVLLEILSLRKISSSRFKVEINFKNTCFLKKESKYNGPLNTYS